MKLIMVLLLFTGCATNRSISDKRLACVKDLMHDFKDYSRLAEITKSCNEIILCPTCIQLNIENENDRR